MYTLGLVPAHATFTFIDQQLIDHQTTTAMWFTLIRMIDSEQYQQYEDLHEDHYEQCLYQARMIPQHFCKKIRVRFEFDPRVHDDDDDDDDLQRSTIDFRQLFVICRP